MNTAATPTDRDARRLDLVTGISGIALVASILINGPLSQIVGRVPTYWSGDAASTFAAYLNDSHRINEAVLFFALSNLIFVFGIAFFAGLRSMAAAADSSGWLSGIIGIAAALFLAGGLLSETLSTGIAVVLRSTPAYHVDVNNVLLLQGLWATALAQGQVALGVVILATSASSVRAGAFPRWLAWYGLVAGLLTILRVGFVTHTVLWIVLLQPGFLWIVAIAVVSMRRGLSAPAGRRTQSG